MPKSNLERNTSWQEPEPELRKRKGRPGIWSAQYRRYDADGIVDRPREVFGDVIEFPNRTAVLIAYTTGMRSSEFLGLMWDDIDFDGQEPRIYIRRGVDGKHVQKTKTEKSKAPVPMCDRVGAALLCYRDEYPGVGGWVFGSLRTGRPLHRTQVGADYLLPALWRMAAKFKLRIPEGTAFHAFRHAYNALITQVGSDDPKRVKEVQMQLMRHTDERVNDRYGKSAAPLRERARQAHAKVTELVMGVN
jgi:integrase